ncbi:MAG: DUF4199 domain-containing protein [Allosphingosinicella sp.]|uniref:DUF4199 domain-containing protein n=1 Tax=Allosphingosinicella sp. TaxID=2823234 RepID=UPI0039387C7A
MKYALVYGILSGVAIIAAILTGLGLFGSQHLFGSQLFGYLVMLVALTLIFVGVKRYRDVEKGGVIRFAPAFGMGLAIAGVAAVAYVAVWEIYLAATDYRFMDDYIAGIVRAREAAGVPPAEIAREVAGFDSMRAWYANPLARVAVTFAEIFPVGLVVALISAALLRNPRLLPARG